MLRPEQVEELMTIVSTMDLEVLIDRLAGFRGRFPVDFTTGFLKSQSADRLQHLFLALCLQHGHVPAEVLEVAA